MNRTWTLVPATTFVLCWFLPVVDEAPYQPNPSWAPGWDALLAALGLNDSTASIVSVASAATNLLMLAALLWLLQAPSKAPPRAAGWVLSAATVLNLFWAWPSEGHIHLGIGYWLWVTSFALAAVLLFRQRRAASALDAVTSK